MVKKRAGLSNIVLILIIITVVLIAVASLIYIFTTVKGARISGNYASCITNCVEIATYCPGADCRDSADNKIECDCEGYTRECMRWCFGAVSRDAPSKSIR